MGTNRRHAIWLLPTFALPATTALYIRDKTTASGVRTGRHVMISKCKDEAEKAQRPTLGGHYCSQEIRAQARAIDVHLMYEIAVACIADQMTQDLNQFWIKGMTESRGLGCLVSRAACKRPHSQRIPCQVLVQDVSDNPGCLTLPVQWHGEGCLPA